MAKAVCWSFSAYFFWGNDNHDLTLNSPSEISLSYCDYGTRDGFAPFAEDGRQQIDPQFVNTTNGNYRLKGASPVLGISPLELSGTDIEGNRLPTSGLTDLGAYTQTIFKDGFDTIP